MTRPPDVPLTMTAAAAALRAGTLRSVDLLSRCTALADDHDSSLGTYLTRFDRTGPGVRHPRRRRARRWP